MIPSANSFSSFPPSVVLRLQATLVGVLPSAVSLDAALEQGVLAKVRVHMQGAAPELQLVAAEGGAAAAAAGWSVLQVEAWLQEIGAEVGEEGGRKGREEGEGRGGWREQRAVGADQRPRG
jgi:hypothetical protein